MNGIGKRVREAAERLLVSDYEGSLIPLSIAANATANREYPAITGDSNKCRQFFRDNMDLLTYFASGGALCAARVELLCKDSITGKNRIHTLDEILYKTIRCQLVHSAELPSHLKLVEHFEITGLPTLILPRMITFGLMLSIVAAPSNRGETTGGEYFLPLDERGGVGIEDVWGDKPRLIEAMRRWQLSKPSADKVEMQRIPQGLPVAHLTALKMPNGGGFRFHPSAEEAKAATQARRKARSSSKVTEEALLRNVTKSSCGPDLIPDQKGRELI